MDCPCGSAQGTSAVYEVKSRKDQERFGTPVPQIGEVVQVECCRACGRCRRTLLYTDPAILAPVEQSATNSLLDFFS